MLKSRISMLVAGALFTAQAGAMSDVWQPDAASLDVISPVQQIAVFSADGLTYAYVPMEEVRVFEPDTLIVSYPDGSYYEIAPNGLSEPISVVAYTAADVYRMRDTYVASYVSPPTYETLLE